MTKQEFRITITKPPMSASGYIQALYHKTRQQRIRSKKLNSKISIPVMLSLEDGVKNLLAVAFQKTVGFKIHRLDYD
jgi:hypothetical protein